jgi:hypothetical protein
VFIKDAIPAKIINVEIQIWARKDNLLVRQYTSRDGLRALYPAILVGVFNIELF